MSIVPKGFQNLGYFIVEPAIKPACFDLPCEKIISLSDCIVNIHPQITLEDFELSPIKKLAENGLFSLSDRRFTHLSDALVFYRKTAKNTDGLRIVGQFAAADIIERYKQGEIPPGCLCDENIAPNGFLGGEILGEDGGLHSYLCNGFEQDLREKFPITWNEWGLIANNYEELRAFADFIEGEGEPVDWLPYLLFDYTPQQSRRKGLPN